MPTIKEVKNEVEKKLKLYISRGKEWVAIHKTTARHILEILEDKK